MDALRTKADVVASWDADVVLMQETKLTPVALDEVRTIFHAKGKTLHHGRPCKITQRKTKKVASASKGTAKGGVATAVTRPRTKIKDSPTDLVNELRATGRWDEVILPAGASTTHFGTSTVYEIAGASQEAKCYRENEALLAKAILRVIEFGDVPYILAGISTWTPRSRRSWREPSSQES